jgi:autotransporter translocation and assembly factor TamB
VSGPARRSYVRLGRYAAIGVLALVLLIAAGVALTQTGWFKNWLRQKVVAQAGQYLNGTLTIERLNGSVFTDVELEGVALHHEGQTAVAMDKLTVHYSPLNMISNGLILDALILDRPTILLQRDNAGWNFNRFVKTRQNTGGRGAPPITMDAVTINDGHVIVKDRGRLVDEVTTLNTAFRFAYLKPGIQLNITQLSGHSPNVNVHSLSGDLGFDRGAVQVRNMAIETDRSKLVTTLSLSGGASARERPFDVDLHAERLSLPEVARYFPPLANINLDPAVDVKGHGTLDALAMNVNVVSTTGNAKGPLVGHFGDNPRLEGTLDVRHVNMQPILNKKEWATDVTGQARFNWVFKPTRINFNFTGPEVEGLGYHAENVHAQGIFEPSLLRFDASGAAYGATTNTRATFRFAAPGRPLSYQLAGNFRNLDMRRLPAKLAMPKLETVAAGQYQFEATGPNWRANGTLSDSMVEGAHFWAGTLVEMDSQNRALHYSASGNVAGLNPRRFSAPLGIEWLDDDRLAGSLNGSFTFDGSGRSVDELVLHTTASLVDSALAGARFPTAQVALDMSNRQMQSTFAGTFERVPGSLFTTKPELADSVLNGSADMAIALSIPSVGPVELQELTGSTTLGSSTIAGIAVDKGQATGSYANQIADIKELAITGPEIQATANGTLAMGSTGASDLKYDVSVTDIEPLAKRFNQDAAGAAHLVGQASGPASKTTMTGTLDGHRLRYGANVDALTANSKYTLELPEFDFARARIQADTAGGFVTIYGYNLPRVTAQTTYQSNDLQFKTLFEEQTRSLGVGGNVLFHPDHNELHFLGFDLAVGQTRWALPPGREAIVQYTSESVTVKNFVLQRPSPNPPASPTAGSPQGTAGVQTLTVEGTAAIGSGSADLANNLNVRLDNVQVRDINELMLGQRTITGVLNANADIRGTRNDPRVAATFDLAAGSVEGVNFNSLTGKASYFGRAVDVDARLEQTTAAVLTAVGTAPVPSGPGSTTRTNEFSLDVKSTPVDIGLFQAATTQLTKMTGQVQANVHVGGTIEAPRLNGLVEAMNAAFTVKDTSVSYSNALARLNFEGDHLFVERFQVSDEDGDDLVAIGDLGIAQRSLGAMNVQVSAHQFKVLDNQLGHVEIDSDIRITGDAAKPQITGELSSPNARLEVDRLLEELTRNPYSTEATLATTTETPDTVAVGQAPKPAIAAKPSLYDAATVNLHVRLPDDLVLRGRDMQASFSRIGLGDMNITVGGDLNVRKDPSAEPEIIGTVSVVRGFYEFQGRRFDVLRDSQIRFLGNKPVDPALQVSAQRIISGVTAIVNIRGTVREPSVTLGSTPPMDEADVLSLIVFNQPINQLGEAERLNLVERAGTLAAGYLTTPLANSIAQALDLDMVEIRASGGINGQPSVALGQQFGSRLFVSFKQEFGSYDRSEISFEYRINELLRLVSTVAQGAQQTHRTQRVDTTGTDLIFVISY